MSIASYANKLLLLTTELSRQWHRAGSAWTDAKSQEFEKEYVDPILTGVNAAAAAIQQLDELVRKVRHDCE